MNPFRRGADAFISRATRLDPAAPRSDEKNLPTRKRFFAEDAAAPIIERGPWPIGFGFAQSGEFVFAIEAFLYCHARTVWSAGRPSQSVAGLLGL